MSATPLISLILCVKNGMPYLPQAVESVRAQTFRDFELIVQDACSTDGSLQYLGSVSGLPAIEIVSEKDGGIGDGYNRAVRRCRGALIGSIDSDNLLEPDALEKAAAHFRAHPEWAAFYGASRMIEADRSINSTWTPPEFDAEGLLRCEVVPPFSVSFFSRAICGGELRFDDSLKTCADYDLWLRLSHLPIHVVPEILGSTRLSNKSMTCRPETYDQFCADKLTALRRHLVRIGVDPEGDLFQRSAGGIYAWAAEALLRLEGRSEKFEKYFQLATSLAPEAKPLEAVRRALSPESQEGCDSATTTPAGATDETFSILRARMGRMLGRTTPVSEDELLAAMNALNELLNTEAAASHFAVQRAETTEALLPLLAQHLQENWANGNDALAEALEILYGRCLAAAA